jgi:glyoxylase-like metal-dependent hydrolase (beta-lactamase superfamily II)
MSTRIAPGVVQIDTRLGGWGEVTAGYLVEGPEPCLVETGSQSSLPTVLAELDALGLGPADLATVVVTHIHLDHAGGVGDIAAAFPRATVLVHEKGARHLVDPDRLVRSAALVYGDLLDALYGRLTPTPADRVRVLGDGEEIRIGPGRTLTSIDSPGHAKHHLGLHDSESGLLFVGDAVGVRLPQVGVLRPATPPPDFDLDLALQSLQRFAARRPAGLALAHYGITPGDPLDLLAEAASTLQGWAAVAEAAFRDGRDIAAALDEAFAHELEAVDPEAREIAETLNGVHANAAGFQRWLQTRSGSTTSGGPGTTPPSEADHRGDAATPAAGRSPAGPHSHAHPHQH